MQAVAHRWGFVWWLERLHWSYQYNYGHWGAETSEYNFRCHERLSGVTMNAWNLQTAGPLLQTPVPVTHNCSPSSRTPARSRPFRWRFALFGAEPPLKNPGYKYTLHTYKEEAVKSSYIGCGAVEVVVDDRTIRCCAAVGHQCSARDPVLGGPCRRRSPALWRWFRRQQPAVDGIAQDADRHREVDDDHDDEERVSTARHRSVLRDECAVRVERLTGPPVGQIMRLICGGVARSSGHEDLTSSHVYAESYLRLPRTAFACCRTCFRNFAYSSVFFAVCYITSHAYPWSRLNWLVATRQSRVYGELSWERLLSNWQILIIRDRKQP